MRSRSRTRWIGAVEQVVDAEGRRIAVSSRVPAAKRASELEATTNIQRKRASAVVISSARPCASCASSSVVPTSCSGITPTCGAAAAGAGIRLAAPARRLRPACDATGSGGGAGGRSGMASARGPADLRQQLLGLSGGRGVQQIGQHGAAAVVGLDRHAALARARRAPASGPPGAFVRPIDLQQPLGGRNRGFRLLLFAQQGFGDASGRGRAPVRARWSARRRRSGRCRRDPPAARRPAGTATPAASVLARSTSSTSTQTTPGRRRDVIPGDRQDLGAARVTAPRAGGGSPGAATRGPAPPAGGSTAARPGGRAAPAAATKGRSPRAAPGSCARAAARSRW